MFELSSSHLLASLPEAELDDLSRHLECVTLARREVVSVPGGSDKFGYFPTSGIFSVISVAGKGEIETGVVGREGFIGASIILLAGQSSFKVVAQAPAQVLRLPRGKLIEAFEELPGLRTVLLKYIQTFIVQATFTALAHGRCTIEQRLARWLLMSQDRLETDEVPVTHEYLSRMLAVRRAGITDAIHLLEGKLMIKGTRGKVHIRDRAALLDMAGTSYGIPEREYDRILHAMRGKTHGSARGSGVSEFPHTHPSELDSFIA